MADFLNKPGGSEMIKVRFQGTKEDMEWLQEQIKQIPNIQITESSKVFPNKGTEKYFRKYLEIEPKNLRK